MTQNLLGEKQMKRLMGRGNPDATAMRTGYAAIKHHMQYLGWLSETRKWLAGATISLADFAAAAHLSALDYIGDVDWTVSGPAKEWYAQDQVASELSRIAGGSCRRRDPAGALRGPRFLRRGLPFS